MEERTGLGTIRLSDSAIGEIACVAAKSVEGVSGIDSGALGNLAEAIGAGDFNRGVKVSFNHEIVSVEISVMITFGYEVSDTAEKVQDRIKESIEKMTGLIVDKVNININGVRPSK